MVVDRVEVSASCGMEPFLPLGSVVRIGLPAPFLSLRKMESHWCGIQCHGRVEVFPLVGECPKKSFFMACNFPNVVYSMCVARKGVPKSSQPQSKGSLR